VPPATTTTVVVPPNLQPRAESAAGILVSGWAAGDRGKALSVATPQAVNTLFSVPYPGGLAIDRGCSSSAPPVVCTYGPPGGGPPNSPIYQIYASEGPAGWFVSSVVIESPM
jgi:hypothetical protein